MPFLFVFTVVSNTFCFLIKRIIGQDRYTRHLERIGQALGVNKLLSEGFFAGPRADIAHEKFTQLLDDLKTRGVNVQIVHSAGTHISGSSSSVEFPIDESTYVVIHSTYSKPCDSLILYGQGAGTNIFGCSTFSSAADLVLNTGAVVVLWQRRGADRRVTNSQYKSEAEYIKDIENRAAFVPTLLEALIDKGYLAATRKYQGMDCVLVLMKLLCCWHHS